jgi:hypothetical protein
MPVRDTSVEAYIAHYLPAAPGLKRRILEFMWDHDDATNNEIEHGTSIPINAVTSTVFALREDGVLEELAKRPSHVTGIVNYCWRVVTNPKPVPHDQVTERRTFYAVLTPAAGFWPEYSMFESKDAAEQRAAKDGGRVVKVREA